MGKVALVVGEPEDASRAGVVGGDRERLVSVEEVDEPPQVVHAEPRVQDGVAELLGALEAEAEPAGDVCAGLRE